MRVGLIADTHDARQRTHAALQLLDEHGAEILLHAGDLTSGKSVPLYDGWEVWLVEGNGDWDEQIQRAIDEHEADIRYGQQHVVEADGARIGLVHGEYDGQLEALIQRDRLDLVVHGHSHEFRDEQVGSTRVVNPGALYRTPAPSVCVYDTDEDEVERLWVDGEGHR